MINCIGAFYGMKMFHCPFRLVLTTVIYGTASALWHVLHALHQVVTDLKDAFPVASRLIFNHFFVDDLHECGYSLSEGLLASDQLISLLADAGFSLKKWTASSPLLLSDLFPCGHEETVDFLGLNRQPPVDTLSFPSEDSVHSPEQITKRSVLAQTARLFDPCGWIAAVVFSAKHFMQQLCQCSYDWDSPLAPEFLSFWNIFLNSLHHLSTLRVTRALLLKGQTSNFMGCGCFL